MRHEKIASATMIVLGFVGIAVAVLNRWPSPAALSGMWVGCWWVGSVYEFIVLPRIAERSKAAARRLLLEEPEPQK